MPENTERKQTEELHDLNHGKRNIIADKEGKTSM